jgi:hypothetical protein
MTNQNFPIGSIEWLNAMQKDFDLNRGKPAPAPVLIYADVDVQKLHAEVGDVLNGTRALHDTVEELQATIAQLSARADDIRARLIEIKGVP